jgi:hypothetical protein
MRKALFAVLAVLALAGLGRAQSNCVTSAPSQWTGTGFSPQATTFSTVPFMIAATAAPTAGSGGPVFSISQNNLNGLTGNQYPQAAVLIRQSENGFWEVYNGTSNTYTHNTAVQWQVNTPPSGPNFQVTPVIPQKTYQVTITTAAGTPCASGCLLTAAGGNAFRSTAPATTLGFWNLDQSSTTNAPLMICGFALAMPNPIISTLSPNSGPIGSLVSITGSNFGASQGNSTVSFGGVPATSIQAWNATSITATVPSTANNGNVIVTVNNLISNGIAFTVTQSANPNPPLVVSVSQTAQLGLACGPNQPPPANHSVSLTWTASTSTGITAYDVYRSTTSGGSYLKLGSTTAAVLTYTDSTVAQGATYFYVVTAVAGAQESVYSNQVSASIP